MARVVASECLVDKVAKTTKQLKAARVARPNQMPVTRPLEALELKSVAEEMLDLRLISLLRPLTSVLFLAEAFKSEAIDSLT